MFFLLMWPGKSLEFSAEFGGKVKGTGTLCGFNDSSGFTFDIQVNQHLRPDFLIPTCASGLKTRISKTNPSGFWSCGHLQTCMWFLMTICGHLRWMIRPMCELKRWVFNDIESEGLPVFEQELSDLQAGVVVDSQFTGSMQQKATQENSLGLQYIFVASNLDVLVPCC